MSDKKQSAVEWFEEQYMKGTTILPVLFQQAKQLEKEQNAEAYKKGWDEGTDALYKEVRKIYDANRIFYNIDS
jgi:hypothetical protein